MTIRKGEKWGVEKTAPDDLLALRSDADLAAMEVSRFGALLGGDIHLALGSPMQVKPGSPCTQLEIDAIRCEILTMSGEIVVTFAASVVEIGALRPLPIRHRRHVCITNGGIVSGRNLAPRAHPNDGILDCVEISPHMPFRDRLSAVKKSLTGTHIPHPDITVTRGETFTFHRLHGGERIRLDGRRMQSWESITVTVLPDYWKIVV